MRTVRAYPWSDKYSYRLLAQEKKKRGDRLHTVLIVSSIVSSYMRRFNAVHNKLSTPSPMPSLLIIASYCHLHATAIHNRPSGYSKPLRAQEKAQRKVSRARVGAVASPPTTLSLSPGNIIAIALPVCAPLSSPHNFGHLPAMCGLRVTFDFPKAIY